MYAFTIINGGDQGQSKIFHIQDIEQDLAKVHFGSYNCEEFSRSELATTFCSQPRVDNFSLTFCNDFTSVTSE